MQRSNSDSGLTAKRSVLKTRLQNDKEQIFCEWRHRWVRLTPEEWVRQQVLHRLVESLHYPFSRIAVEVAFHLGDKRYRADAVVYDATMRPLMLVECKAETVVLTQKTLDQAVTYNRQLEVPYLLLHNGPQTIFVDLTSDSPTCKAMIPDYGEVVTGYRLQKKSDR